LKGVKKSAVESQGRHTVSQRVREGEAYEASCLGEGQDDNLPRRDMRWPCCIEDPWESSLYRFDFTTLNAFKDLNVLAQVNLGTEDIIWRIGFRISNGDAEMWVTVYTLPQSMGVGEDRCHIHRVMEFVRAAHHQSSVESEIFAGDTASLVGT
jgi:hypothetical protein